MSLSPNINYQEQKNSSSSNIKSLFDNNEDKKEHGQIRNNEEIDENDEIDENAEIDEIAEEEQKELNNDNNSDNKEESQSQRNQEGEGENKLEKLFIYLRTGFSWRPIPTINTTVLCLEITGAIFIIIGIILILFSNKIKEIEIRYDNNENCINQKVCEINFTINENMEKNVFIYYGLKNFYQNHRRYIKSKSIKQLKGNILTEDEIKDDCDPIILNKDLYEGIMSISEKPLDPNGVAHPCGLIAKSFFNDTFKIKKQEGGEQIIINSNGIAWDVDKEKYKDPENNEDNQWRRVNDERFMIWMRPAAMPDFRKPWGRIETDLIKGNYIVTIENNYPVKSFDGKKYFILSTVNGLGGKNYFLAILYLVVGGVSIIAGIFFWFGYKKYNIEKSQKIE